MKNFNLNLYLDKPSRNHDHDFTKRSSTPADYITVHPER